MAEQQVERTTGETPSTDPDRPKHDHRLLGLTLAAAALMVAASFIPWSSGSGLTLNGVEGSNNAWVVIIGALVVAISARALSRSSGSAAVVVGFVGIESVRTVVASTGPPDLGHAFGWWLALAAGFMMIGAVVWAIINRINATKQGRPVQVLRHRGVRVVTVLGIVFFVALTVVFRHVVVLSEAPSWPPPDDAVTAAEAQSFTEAFVADGRGLDDLDVAYAPSTAASIDPHPDGKNFFPLIFEDLQAAEESIHIIMYGYAFTDVGTEIKEILLDKLDEGVEVRLLVDSYGSLAFIKYEDSFAELADAGAEIVVNDVLPVAKTGLWQDRSIQWSQKQVGRAEHRKLIIVDGETSWIGGSGFEDHFRNGKFHEVMSQVKGDVVLQAQAVFLTSFSAHGGPLPADLSAYFPDQPDPGDIGITIVQVVPGGFTPATQAVREMIDGAEDRIDVMNPYLTDADMIKRLENAAERGVKVRFVTSEHSNNAATEAAIKHRYQGMLDAGIEIWEYPDAVVHVKLVIADDEVVFGTLNLDAWSLYRDYEISMKTEDAAVADAFEERLFDPDIDISKPGEAPSGFVEKTRSWFYDKLAYFV